jgi:glycerophosphoryl diester phosphodiesterase
MNLREFVTERKLIVAAHRGSSGEAPENTMAAFALAIEQGAQMIETDIHFTSDNEIVAFHDLSRFKKQIGKEPTEGYSYEQLRRLDVGSWKSVKFAGERIPRFADILELIKDKIFLNLEIKTRKNDNDIEKIRQVRQMILKYGVQDQVLICSFNHEFLTALKRNFPEASTAAIKTPYSIKLPSETAAVTGCEAYICAVSELNERISDDVKKHQLFLGVYTVDKPEKLDDILKYNVTAIGTNYPAIILKELMKKKLI